MNIALLSPYYPYRGGIAQFSEQLTLALEEAGHHVRVFGFTRLYPDILFPGKSQYVEEAERRGDRPSERVLDSVNPLSYGHTVRAIRRFAPDVLIISYWMSFFVPAYAHIANRLKGECRVLLLVHNAIPHEPRFFDKPLAKLLFRQCHGFLTMSDAVARDVERLCPGAQPVVSPHPLYNQFGAKKDKDEAREKLSLPQRKTLLFFGLIREYKGLDLLLDAMSLLDDTCQLVIAGECYGSFERYQHQIDNSPARERIFSHIRFIADEDIPTFFSAADALILPYRSATQSGVVSIAYVYDLPMVSTPVGDFSDSIAKAEAGVVVPEVSARALVDGIREVLRPENREIYYKGIAREKAERSWGRFVERLMEGL